jgi:hypothetical protein
VRDAVVIDARRARRRPVAHDTAIRAALERVAHRVAPCRLPVVQLRRHRVRPERVAAARLSRSLAQRSTCDDLAASHAHSGPQNSQRVIATGRRYVAAQRRHSRDGSPARYGPGHTADVVGCARLRPYSARLLLRWTAARCATVHGASASGQCAMTPQYRQRERGSPRSLRPSSCQSCALMLAVSCG